MIWLALGLVLVYGLFIIRLIWAWRQISGVDKSDPSIFITVIIPVRNEAQSIVQTVQAILANNYPKDRYEVLVVDDHSSDYTIELVKNLNQPNVRCIQLTVQKTGKKAAISGGVEHANGELIVCTDGDTVVAENWLSLHQSAFSAGNQMAFGSVRYSGKGFLVDLLNLELTSLIGVGGAMMTMGHPSMINGCNYSFAKNAFLAVDGFNGNESVATGDDEFLLRKIYWQFPNQVHFIKNDQGTVTTESVQSWSEFYHQRKRWASKWKHHRDWQSIVLPMLTFAFYALFVCVIFQLSQTAPVWAAGLILIKCLFDFVFVKEVCKSTGIRVKATSFLLLQIIYPFYAVFFGLASNFGQYRWKQRTHKI